jgi:branched-chain amino acid aminotransferase
MVTTATQKMIWRNGALVPESEALVPINAVGHASVGAVFEGLRAYRDTRGRMAIFRGLDHMKRLHASLRVVRLPCPYSAETLVDATAALLSANKVSEDTYIRPWVFIGGVVRTLSQKQPPERTETVIDMWPSKSGLLTDRGSRAGVTSWTRISDRSMPPRIKAFSNYHNSRLAVLEAGVNGYDQPIFLNDRGTVAEGAGACLMLVRNGSLVTPTLTSSVLEGITRDTLITLARADGITVEEREVDRTELYLADEVFLVGTGFEIEPLVVVDGFTVGDGRMGPLAKRLDRIYHDAVRGVDARWSDWLTVV